MKRDPSICDAACICFDKCRGSAANIGHAAPKHICWITAVEWCVGGGVFAHDALLEYFEHLNRSEHDAIGFGIACGILTPVVFSCCCAPCLFAAWCEDSLRPTCCPSWCAEIAPAVATTFIPMVVASMAACPHHFAPIMVAYIFHLLASTVACIRVGFASCYAKGHAASEARYRKRRDRIAEWTSDDEDVHYRPPLSRA